MIELFRDFFNFIAFLRLLIWTFPLFLVIFGAICLKNCYLLWKTRKKRLV
jgi:hypothetical protein